MAETFDAIIIGGGVMGASIALHLARRGLKRILLLEREALCAGSTGRSVACVDLLTQHPPVAALQVRSLYAFQHCAELYGDECGWAHTGFAMLGGADAADGIRGVARVVIEAGGQVDLLCRDEYHEIDPASACDDTAVISFAPEGGYLDPVMLTTTFVKSARALGVTVRQYDPAISLRQSGGRATGVDVQSGAIAAGTVIVAAGPWCADFLRPAGIDLPLRPERHSVALLACPAEVSPRISIFDMINLIYARPETGGLTVAGSLDLAMGYDDIRAGDECGAPPMEYGMWVWERMVARYPGMERGELRKGWSGPVTMSPDGQPLLGRLPSDGLFCACGFSGAGMKIAPAVGEMMAGLITGDAAAIEALHPLRPARFTEGQPLMARYAWGTIG